MEPPVRQALLEFISKHLLPVWRQSYATDLLGLVVQPNQFQMFYALLNFWKLIYSWGIKSTKLSKLESENSVFSDGLTAMTARSSPPLHWGILQWALQHTEVARNNVFYSSTERFHGSKTSFKRSLWVYVICRFNSLQFRNVHSPWISVLYESAHKRDVYTELSPGRFWWNVLTRKLFAGTLTGFHFLLMTWTSHRESFSIR